MITDPPPRLITNKPWKELKAQTLICNFLMTFHDYSKKKKDKTKAILKSFCIATTDIKFGTQYITGLYGEVLLEPLIGTVSLNTSLTGQI